MINEISQITRQLFRKDSLKEVTFGELESFISTYPYVAPARLLLAKKKRAEAPGDLHEEIVTASLYFNNALWYQWQLEQDEEPHTAPIVAELQPEVTVIEEPEEVTPTPTATDNEKVVKEEPIQDGPILFQSYHTIDYFASQGIRLQQAELNRDKLGQQLKSFTEWLRSMKKLPAAPDEQQPAGEDISRQQEVVQNAAHSIEEKEIVTEAMAEVWAKQGNREKAISIYNKLSLLNPAKSAYFATKIDQLK